MMKAGLKQEKNSSAVGIQRKTCGVKIGCNDAHNRKQEVVKN